MVLTALALLVPGVLQFAPAWATWGAGALLGIAPFLAYVASRAVGVPGDPGDVGNRGCWLGTPSLFAESALAVLAAGMLLASVVGTGVTAGSGASSQGYDRNH